MKILKMVLMLSLSTLFLPKPKKGFPPTATRRISAHDSEQAAEKLLTIRSILFISMAIMAIAMCCKTLSFGFQKSGLGASVR